MRIRTNLDRVAFAAVLTALAGSPAAAQGLTPRPVEESSLARDAFATGVLSREQGALPADLWKGADAASVERLIDQLPARVSSASLGETLRRALASPGDSPKGATAGLGGKKLFALVRAGFSDDARAIAALSNAPTGDASLGQALALADLLDGKVAEACARGAALASGRDAPFWVRLRVICYASTGERDAAELTLGLLREQGALSESDETYLSALVAGAAPKSAPPLENAFQLAALRQLKMPLGSGQLRQATAGVLRAVMNDPTFDSGTRAAAAMEAAALGAAGGADLAALYAALPVKADAAPKASDPLADAVAWRRIAAMTAPELQRDKAAAVSAAIAAAPDFVRLRAAALVYGGDIRGFDGMVLAPADALRFSLARLVVGDAAGAAKWLDQTLPPAGAPPLAEPEMMEFISLVSLVAALDPAAGRSLADKANIAVSSDAFDNVAAKLGPVAPDMPTLVEAAFDAAIRGSKGQAALAALAAAAVGGSDDAVGRVVAAQSLRAAGLDSVRRRLLVEQALATRYAAPKAISARAESAPAVVKASASRRPPAAATPPSKKPPLAAKAAPAAKPKPRN